LGNEILKEGFIMKRGFTLAEILITLAIVGIVAVLTIPSVMRNYRNRLYVAQLEKAYAQLSDAAQAIMNDEHVDSFYETSAARANSCDDSDVCTAGTAYFLTNYFKNLKKNCASGDHPCLGDSYLTLTNTGAGDLGDFYCVQTVNGAAICGKYENGLTSFVVDVNGPARPNIAGRDVFSMDMKKNGSLSDFDSGSILVNVPGCEASECGSGSGSLGSSACGCLTAVVEAGWKMEY